MEDHPDTQIIYDDDDIRVIFLPGRSDFILITFGDLNTPVRDHAFFADTPCRKANITAIGIVAKGPHWYPEPSMREAASAILPLLAGHTDRVIYGGSMGGYAAVKYSRLLGATQVLALCPQWSLDLAECACPDPGWQHLFVPAMVGMGVREDEMAGHIFLFADLHNRQDMFHCRAIAARYSQTHMVYVPFVEHHVTNIFAGTGNLLDLIESCRRADLRGLYLFSRRTRRSHGFWRDRVMAATLRRLPMLAYSILEAMAYRDREGFRAQRHHLRPLVMFILARSGYDEAAEFYDDFREMLNPTEQLVLCSELNRKTDSAAKVTIDTVHGTMLVYSITERYCIHVSKYDAKHEFFVKLETFGRSMALHVLIGETKFYLAPDDDGLLAIPSLLTTRSNPFSFSIEDVGHGAFTIMYEDLYLCAETGSRLVCNRPSIDTWERFGFRTYRHAKSAATIEAGPA